MNNKKYMIRLLVGICLLFYGFFDSALLAKIRSRQVAKGDAILFLESVIGQAGQIMQAKSRKARLQAKQQLIDTMKQETRYIDIKKKIGNAIAILIVSEDESTATSKEAYQFLIDFTKAMKTQANLIEVATHVKDSLENISEDEKKEVADEALGVLEHAAQVAYDAVASVGTRLDYMIKLSQASIDKKIIILHRIVDLAEYVTDPENRTIDLSSNTKVFANNYDDVVAIVKREIDTLLNEKELDKVTKDIIMSDIQIIQQATEGTLATSQEAYVRLRDVANTMEKETKQVVGLITQAQESAKDVPIGTMQKIFNYANNKVESLQYGFMQRMADVVSMMPITYEDKQHVLRDQIRSALNVIGDSTNKELVLQAQKQLKDLVDGDDLDEAIKNKLRPILAKIKSGNRITKKEIGKIFFFHAYHDQLKTLENIENHARNIINAATLPSIAIKPDKDNEKVAHAITDQQIIINVMDSGHLYQKIKNEIAPDVTIILSTTDATKDESKKALERLSKIIDTYRPNKAKAMFMSGFSRLHSYLPQSIQSIIPNDPNFYWKALGILGAEWVFFKYVLDPLRYNYRLWMRNYKSIQADHEIYGGILYNIEKAEKQGDENKFHMLMGILEGLGVEVTDEYDKEGQPLRIFQSPGSPRRWRTRSFESR